MRLSRRLAVYSVGGFGEHSFSYTGNYEFTRDGKGWLLKFLTNGTLTLRTDVNVDVFSVGGGGGGGASVGGGGGGGYTKTLLGLLLPKNTAVDVFIAIGGSGASVGSTSSHTNAGRGTSSYIEINGTRYNQADGGYGGDNGDGSATGRRGGGNGGSGGGGGSYGTGMTGGKGGSNGGNGSKGTYTSGNSSRAGSGGTGQGYTTRAFGEPDGEIYSGGGGAALSGARGDETATDSSYGGTHITPVPNRGGGGGGGSTNGAGIDGGAGIVIFRNAR